MSSSASVDRPDVVAAGAVVLRKGPHGSEVLLVHRPRYDDWSFPKGKLDRGEHIAVCAVREVREETGAQVALGLRLGDQRYLLSTGRGKVVHYWVARLRPDSDHPFEPNDEVDEIRWVTFDDAAALLSYDYDRVTLAQARAARRRTDRVLVLRHATAMPRRDHPTGPDRLRPLEAVGLDQAERLADLLGAWGSAEVVSSSSVRCTQTVAPFADAEGVPLAVTDALSEEDSDAPGVAAVVAALPGVEQGQKTRGLSTVVCSHRPVLPLVLQALGAEPVDLAPGEFVVVHLRRGAVVSTERHQPV